MMRPVFKLNLPQNPGIYSRKLKLKRFRPPEKSRLRVPKPCLRVAFQPHHARFSRLSLLSLARALKSAFALGWARWGPDAQLTVLGDTSPFLPGIRIWPENQTPRGNSDRFLERTMVGKNEE